MRGLGRAPLTYLPDRASMDANANGMNFTMPDFNIGSFEMPGDLDEIFKHIGAASPKVNHILRMITTN